MNSKVFNIRLSKEHCQNDQDIMNAFLNEVEIKVTSTHFVTTSSIDYWSVLLFFEPKKEKKEKNSDFQFSENELKTYDALKSWRNNVAQNLNWSPFMICYNAHLAAIAKSNPRSIEELKEIKNFGNHRIEKYGEEIMSVLNAL